MTHVIVDDTSTDVDAVREDLRFELIVLHTEVKKLDAGWDFTAVVKPLLDDQGSPDPCKFPQRELRGDLLSAVTNRWLVFQNIKIAAINQNFTLVEIGYNRNEAFLAAK
jgi:hypothetical protein